jgi:hypothetical protein
LKRIWLGNVGNVRIRRAPFFTAKNQSGPQISKHHQNFHATLLPRCYVKQLRLNRKK